MSDDLRLDRIERKIDQLSEAMVALARTEEKIMSMEKNNHTAYDRLNRHSEKIDSLEDKILVLENTIATISKLWWIAISVGAASIATHFWGVF